MTTPNDSLDFYPTPDSLAFDMVFSLREVKSGFTTYPKPILEPSAGDGALARQVHALAFNVHHDHKTGEVDYYDKGKARSAELDCIELSSDFRAVLKKDGFRVVHDNFLTFRPTTKYAAIVMNPPFSAGAAHLLKALDVMQDGGKIRCLLNAETLRNPCTNERKELAAKLEELHATVKYIPDAFKNARPRRPRGGGACVGGHSRPGAGEPDPAGSEKRNRRAFERKPGVCRPGIFRPHHGSH